MTITQSAFQLSLEQQLEVKKFEMQMGNLSREELEKLFLQLMQQHLVNKNIMRDLMRRYA